MLNQAIAVWLLPFAIASCAQNQNDKQQPDFPKKEEIQLAVSQAERAFELYKNSVALEARLPSSKENDSAVKKDQELVKAAEKLVNGLKQNPDAFHGVGGLLLLSTLDDASRNAALCSGQDVVDITAPLSSRDKGRAFQILHLEQNCIDVSAHLFTVSESVQALLVREMTSQQLLNQKAMQVINNCNAALKNKSSNE